jgi:paraquat-inducible protein A
MDRTLRCHACHLTLPNAAPECDGAPCPRCRTTLHRRFPHALQRSAAFALAGLVMLVPANVLPVLSSNLFGAARTDTIMSGVLSLYRDGLWGIALIVFAASIAVPLLKLVSLGLLLRAAHRGTSRHRRGLTRLYAFVRFVGRWSMLDVFLVAFLTGAVRFGSLASVRPEPGVIAFAAAVLLTVFATESFDSRLLWDQDATPEPATP